MDATSEVTISFADTATNYNTADCAATSSTYDSLVNTSAAEISVNSSAAEIAVNRFDVEIAVNYSAVEIAVNSSAAANVNYSSADKAGIVPEVDSLFSLSSVKIDHLKSVVHAEVSYARSAINFKGLIGQVWKRKRLILDYTTLLGKVGIKNCNCFLILIDITDHFIINFILNHCKLEKSKINDYRINNFEYIKVRENILDIYLIQDALVDEYNLI